jgi:hypothetical protein
VRFAEGLVRGDRDAGFFLPFCQDLEQQLGAAAVEFHVAELSVLCRYRHSTDNAVGLFHTTGPSLSGRAGKYLPLLPVLRELVLRADTPLEDDVKRMIAGQFDKTGGRLCRHLR